MVFGELEEILRFQTAKITIDKYLCAKWLSINKLVNDQHKI